MKDLHLRDCILSWKDYLLRYISYFLLVASPASSYHYYFMRCRLSCALHPLTTLVIGHQRRRGLAFEFLFKKAASIAFRNLHEQCGNPMSQIQ